MPAEVLVIGLGYVGLPLAREAARAGYHVTGFDTRREITGSLNAGQSHVDDLTDQEVAAMLEAGFRAMHDERTLSNPDVIVICVPTPLSAADGPDLTAVRAATETAGKLLKPGALVSLESTTYPGTTDEVVRPILEKASGLTAGIGFSLAFSPERIDPGNPDFGLRNTPKVVGGVTPECTDAAQAFYANICDQVVTAKSAREAEMAKLLENTYRHVNIALVNEMAIFCRELGVDLWDAIRCAVTASRSTRTTCPTRSAPSATRSGSWNWLRRSTAGCPATSPNAPPNCSTATPSRSTGRGSCCSA
jgi:nucleotide sugar dehydrogenase